MQLNVLIVDDDPIVSATLKQQVVEFGYCADTASNGASAKELAAANEYQIILLDLALPDTTGLELLQSWQEELRNTVFIMISGRATVPDAVKAMKLGAFDFLVKPVDMEVLEAVILKAAQSWSLHSENTQLRQLVSGDAITFIGQAPAITELLTAAKRIANGEHPILLEGETGTGKQVLARLIHAHSDRSRFPFVTVNCAAITETLFESELFGHERGAFTGAIGRKPGKLELVGKGTLFLDEIGELPAACQAKLLTAVEDRVFERVGGIRSLNFEGRIIAATNRDLLAEIQRGGFRRDLYFRLNTFHLKLPALRAHSQDIPEFIHWALEQCRRRFGRNYQTPDEETIRGLTSYPWPGNVRELLHHVERIALLSENDRISRSFWLSFPSAQVERTESVPDDLREATDAFRQKHILRVLAESGMNQTEAAKRLGIERSHLNRILAEYEGRRGS